MWGRAGVRLTGRRERDRVGARERVGESRGERGEWYPDSEGGYAEVREERERERESGGESGERAWMRDRKTEREQGERGER